MTEKPTDIVAENCRVARLKLAKSAELRKSAKVIKTVVWSAPFSGPDNVESLVFQELLMPNGNVITELSEVLITETPENGEKKEVAE